MLNRRRMWAGAGLIVMATGLGACRMPRTPAAERVVTFATFVGGSGSEAVRDVTGNSAGNVYITGGTDSRDFPTTQGVAQPALAGGTDVFVTKLDPQGRIVWSTLLGGPSDDRAYALEVDAEGYVYLGGRAGAGFPVTAGAFQTEFRGGPPIRGVYPSQSGFVAKLSPDGRRVLFASYVGAFDDPSHPVRDIALAAGGDVYACTSTSTGDYPDAVRAAFRRGARPTRPGGKDGVVLRLKGDGSRVLWATFLGGSGREEGECSIRSGADGSVTYMAVTGSPDAPATPDAHDRTLGGPSDFYVVRLSADGSRVLWATYLGGSATEDTETHGLAVDAAGQTYVVGGSTSTDFPTTAGALQRTYGGAGGQGTGAGSNHQGDAVVAKLSSDGRRLLAATYVGGRFGDAGEGVGVDARGNVYLSGGSFSGDFPVSPEAFQARNAGRIDFIVVKLSPDLGRLLYASYLGGRSGDAGRGVHVEPNGSTYVAGETGSADFPTRHALQPRHGGRSDGALIKLDLAGEATR